MLTHSASSLASQSNERVWRNERVRRLFPSGMVVRVESDRSHLSSASLHFGCILGEHQSREFIRYLLVTVGKVLYDQGEILRIALKINYGMM